VPTKLLTNRQIKSFIKQTAASYDRAAMAEYKLGLATSDPDEIALRLCKEAQNANISHVLNVLLQDILSLEETSSEATD
jgi:hypothetical protein